MSRKFDRYLLATVLLLFGIYGRLYSQEQNVVPYIQSPNAAMLGTYGNFDISPFTGLPNISIPVFSEKEGDIPVNCRLTYMGGGIKPSAHPGWVGQGWMLNVGGVITRKVNGGVDEVANSQAKIQNLPSLLNLYALYESPNYTNLNNTAYGPWYSTQFISNYYEQNTNPNTGTADLSKLCNLAPDEFDFTLPTGVSGSFYLDYTGNWQVKSKSAAYLQIVASTSPVTLTNTYNANSTIIVNRAFYSFQITDEAGYIYTFGNSTNAIEFTRGPRPYGPSAVPYNEDVVASAWLVTKIQSPTGNVVNFSYVRKQNLYVQTAIYPGAETLDLNNYSGSGGTYGSWQTMTTYSGQVISPVYLSQITSRTLNINFNISPTTELQYPYQNNVFASANFNYSDLEISDVTSTSAFTIDPLSVWYKLDSITVSDLNNTLRDKFLFTYNNNSTERLFLGNFLKRNLTVANSDQEYHFAYNPTTLPGYNSLQLDQWGYYNGIQFPSTVTVNSSVLNYLIPNVTYAQAGILQTITYPTGGTTTFNYGLNDFTSVVQKNQFAISLVNQTGTGGGLRINSIVNTDGFGNSYTTQYNYQKFSNGTATGSSGVMRGYNKIYYNLTVGSSPSVASISMINFDDYSQCLNYTDGRDVVYSEVQEVFPDGSYKLYDYSNSDNAQYMDELPIGSFTDGFIINNTTAGTVGSSLTSSNSWPLLSHSSRELERGQLLSLREYTPGGALLLRQTTYAYNSDPNRFNTYIRSFDNYGLVAALGSGFIEERYFQAVKIYTYYPYLQSETQTVWDQNGANPVTTTKTFTYDPVNKNKKTESYTASNGLPVSISYNYPSDAIANLSTSAQNAQTALVAAHVLSTPLETITMRNNIQTEHSRTDYGIFTGALGNFEMPAVDNKSVSGLALEPRVQYNAYDGYGHLLEKQNVGDLKHAYLWGYNNSYAVADVANSSYATVAALVNQTTLNNPGTDAAMRTALSPVASGLASTNAQVTTYTYTPLVGLTSQTDPRGKNTYFAYDGLNRLSTVSDFNNNVLKYYAYTNSFQLPAFPNILMTENLTPSCSIDYTAVPYTYTVPAGMFTSSFNQLEANQIASKYMTANGQAAANTNGTCNPDLLGSNSNSYSMTVTLTNTSTGNVTTVVIPVGASSTILTSIAAGTYNVKACQNSATGTFGFEIGSSTVNGSGSTCITISNVPIHAPSDGAMYVYPPGHAP